jgi:lysophospholipase L1-like esterase
MGARPIPTEGLKNKPVIRMRYGRSNGLCIPSQYRSRWLSVAIVLCCLLLAACVPFAPQQGGATVVQQVAAANLTYVALGASDTFGVGTENPQSQNWASDLATMLGKHVHLINLGVPDITLHSALGVELPVALDAHPGLVTIWLAVNDLADNVPLASYSHDLNLLLTRLRSANPHVRIAVANVPDLTLLPHFQSYDKEALRAQILAYNETIANAVNAHHVLLVDLYSSELAQHPEYISDDGFHPNALGYTRVAQLFYQVVKTKAP